MIADLPAGRLVAASSAREAGAVFLIGVTIYLLCAPRSVMLDDDGYFILAAFFDGVAHPPGYPLYTLLAHLATRVPIGSVAFRVHALSGVFAALACACVWLFSMRLSRDRTVAWIASLCLAFSAAFWSQAIVAEVYTLNALLFFILCVLAITGDGSEDPGNGRWIAFFYGLSLANHWPLMILSSPALIALLWPRRRSLLRRARSLLAPFLLGLLPYAWMVVRSRLSEISFYGPIGSWSDFWYYLSREGYAQVDYSPSADWGDKLQFAGFAVKETWRQFGPFGAAFAAFGFVVQWKSWPLHVCCALSLAFLAGTVALIALLGFDYDLLHQNVFRVYPLVSYAAAALWLGLGAGWSVQWIAGRHARRLRAEFLKPAAGVLLVGTTLAANVSANFRAADTWAEDYARAVLESLERGAVLFTHGDYVTGPLGYLNKVEGFRSDVILFSANGQVFDNRLWDPYKPVYGGIRAAVEDLIASHPGHVYYALLLPHDHGSVFYGLYHRVAPELPATLRTVVLTPRIARYFESLFQRRQPADLSQLIHYRQLQGLYCQLIANIVEHPPAEADASVRKAVLDARCSGYQGLLQQAIVKLNSGSADAGEILTLLDRARLRSGEAVTVANRALLYYLYGRTYLDSARPETAREFFSRSVSIWSAADNPAFGYLGSPD